MAAAEVQIASGSPAIAAVEWLAAWPGVDFAGFDRPHTTVAELSRWREALPSRLRRNFLSPLPVPLWNRCAGQRRRRTGLDERSRADGLQACSSTSSASSDPELPRSKWPPSWNTGPVCWGRRACRSTPSLPRACVQPCRTAMRPPARLPRRGFLTLDFGVALKAYRSDMTRTVYLGKPRANERDAYAAVLEAQQAGVAAVASGVSCGAVDEATRSVLRRAGLAEAFTHSTGHGVGLEIHESPPYRRRTDSQAGPRHGCDDRAWNLSGRSVWHPHRGYVAVTRTGGQVLTPAPKALIEL